MNLYGLKRPPADASHEDWKRFMDYRDALANSMGTQAVHRQRREAAKKRPKKKVTEE